MINAIVQNGGQTCSAGSRALIQRGAYDQFVEQLIGRFRGLVAGSHDEDLDLGALISARQKERVEGYISRADAPQAPLLAHEEVCGPVLSCLSLQDEADAVRIANGTDYGLVAGVWSRDAGRLMRMAKALRCAQVFLNAYGTGAGVELPFGGVGRSDHGCEKGFAALHEFSQIKTIVHNHQH